MYKSHVLWLRSGSPENLTLAPLNSPSCWLKTAFLICQSLARAMR